MRSTRLARYVARVTLQSIRNAWLLQVVTVGTIATVFVILSGSLLIGLNLRSLLLGSKGGAYVSVYLQDGSAVGQEIRSKHCDRKFVEACEEVSAEEARKRFLRQNPDLKETVTSLSESPFPPSVEIRIDPSFKDREALESYVKELRGVAGVTAVDDGGEWMQRWVAVVSLLDWALWTLGGLLALATVFVVANTIKLIVYARRDEIEILNLVGATDALVRAPFLLEGLFQGLVGSALALGFLKGLFWISTRHISTEWGGFLPVSFSFLPPPVQMGLLLGGALLGVIGSAMAVGRFLRL